MSRNFGVKVPPKHVSRKSTYKRTKHNFESKSRDNFNTIKSKFESDIDRTANNMIIFNKKKIKNGSNKKASKNSRIFSYITHENYKTSHPVSGEQTLDIIKEKPNHFQSRHLRMRSIN